VLDQGEAIAGGLDIQLVGKVSVFTLFGWQ